MATKTQKTKAKEVAPKTGETKPVNEGEQKSVSTEIAEEQKEQAKAVTPEEAGKKPTEDPKNTQPADTALGVNIRNEYKTGYTIQDGDFVNYPELKNQGVKPGDTVEFGTLWVLKSITATAPRTTRVPWPSSVNNIT